MKKVVVLSIVLFFILSPALSGAADPIFPDLSGLDALFDLGSCLMSFGGPSRSVKPPKVKTDLDNDGYEVVDGDCDDFNAAIHPGAIEIPGNIWDENCDNISDCYPDATWKNHDEFVACVSQAVEQLVSAGAITEMRGNWMIESASGLKAIGRVPKEPAEDLRLELTQVEGVASLSPQQKRDEEKLAYVIKSQSVTTVSLRTEPRTLLDTYIRTMLLRYDFYDVRWNPQGSFDNQFVDNGDGTITDRSTGLMWQKSGSSRMKSREGARAYVSHLNGFAGHGNWRLPTIYELASLLEREKKYGVHIDPVFDYKQKRCWSSDRGYTVHVEEEWILDYDEGRVSQAIISDYDVYKRYDKNYVRAVRSIE